MQTELNARQRLAAQLLAAGQTGRQVAKAVKINPATLSGWRQQPHFQRYVSELIIQAEKHAMEALHGLRMRAVERLGELLESSPGVSLRAALAILQATPQPHEYLPPTADQAAWLEMLKVLQTAKSDEQSA